MLGFNQDEYLTSAREIIAARKQAETVADDIYDSGCVAHYFCFGRWFPGADDGN